MMSKLFIYIYIYCFCMLFSYSWKSTTLFRKHIASRQRLSYSATLQDIEQICKSSGPKPTFQELCQNVFQGKYPVYVWSSEVLEVVVPNVLTETFSVDLPTDEVLTNARKKEEENRASAELIRSLYFSPVYRPIVTSYFSQRLNKDNPPLRFTRNDMLNLLSFKAVAILIDVENVGDMRKFFYATKAGDIKCLCPPGPQLFTAPAIFDSAADESKAPSAPIGYVQPYSDEEMLVLAYAHDAAGSQAAMANRVTYSEHKDAADAMMLYDLGAIQLLKNLRKIILVTKDKFSINAQACFYNDDRRYSKDDLSTDIGRLDLPFITVESCKDLVQYLGRIATS